MGTRYRRLTIEERCELARLHSEGHSVRQIAASLDRSPSTVARELKRNGSKTQGYRPSYARQQAQARRCTGSGPEGNAALREQALSRLQAGWSPQQVAGRLALESGGTVISHESICRFIYARIRYARIRRTKDYGWRYCLPKARSKRGWRGRKGGSPASFIARRRPLSERPPEAAGRQEPGHWEADLMLFGNRGQALPVMTERQSRLLAAARLTGKAAQPVAQAMTRILAPFPAHWSRSAAIDNGTEFAQHYQLHRLGVETFFCDVRSPWQKGAAEGSGGEPHRTPAPVPATPDRHLRLSGSGTQPTGTGRQQHPSQVPGLSHSNRNLLEPSVALEM